MYSRDIVILANSRKTITLNSVKYSGHCIAGKDIRTKEWVRLICIRDRSGNTIPFTYQDLNKLCGDGNGPALFSRFRINFHEKCGIYCQPENELISGEPWQHFGNTPLDQLPLLMDPHYPCWLGDPSYGRMDNIPFSVCNPQSHLPGSLLFTKLTADDHKLGISHKETMHGRTQYLLQFTINTVSYSWVITDISVEDMLRKKILPEGPLSSAYMTAGIGQIYPEMNAHYKLVVGLAPLK